MPRLNPLHISAWVGLHCFDERFHTISTGSTEEGVIGRGRVGEAEKGWVAEGLWVGEDDGCGGGIGLRYQPLFVKLRWLCGGKRWSSHIYESWGKKVRK